MSLNDIRDEVTRIAVEHGFVGATFGEDLMLMVSELSEALEEYRMDGDPKSYYYIDKSGEIHEAQIPYVNGSWDVDNPRKPMGVASEIADVIIRALHFCGKHGIDISQAVEEKILYNRSRPYRHGGKKL